jgi:hypothetical protein
MSLNYGLYTYNQAATSTQWPNEYISVPPSSSDIILGLTWRMSLGDEIRIKLVEAYSMPVGLNWTKVHVNLTVYELKNINYLFYFVGGRPTHNYTSLGLVYTSNFTLLTWRQMPNSSITFTSARQGTEYYYIPLTMVNTDNTSIALGTFNLHMKNFDANTAQSGETYMIASVIPFSVALLLPLMHWYYSLRRGRKKRFNMAEAPGQELRPPTAEEFFEKE